MIRSWQRLGLLIVATCKDLVMSSFPKAFVSTFYTPSCINVARHLGSSISLGLKSSWQKKPRVAHSGTT